jgi:hypothetical protein
MRHSTWTAIEVSPVAHEAARGPTLVLADIEGGEKELLDPALVDRMKSVDILVETHDGLLPGSTQAMMERLSATHDIERTASRPRTLADHPSAPLPTLAKLMSRIAIEPMSERRGIGQEWLFMTVNSHGT